MQTQHTRLQALYQTPAGIFGPSNCDKGRLLSLDSIRFLLDDSLFKADPMALAHKGCGLVVLGLNCCIKGLINGNIWICDSDSYLQMNFVVCYLRISHLVPCPTKNNANKVPRWFFPLYRYQKCCFLP